MEERHRDILRRHKSILEKDLEPKDILSELTTVLNQHEEDAIKVQSTRMERCDKLFDILPRKGPKAFKVFIEALKNQTPHLASCLIEAEESPSRCEGLKNERDSARKENLTLEKEIQELKKKSEDYERKNQALQKELQRQNEEMKELQRKNEEMAKRTLR
ncbi:caspase-2-like [Acropora millepora]|uniref:caspase-2-like n=1 Tax=Acropora millepora TaxID=45264 RepID=UPI001CF17DCB|nr:caspase-2-like [Acropora millepora]